MQSSVTYNYENNDPESRKKIALICSEYFGIKDVDPDLYKIAVPVSELACQTKDGEYVSRRSDIEEATPWNERSMTTFGVVYRYESTASFIGIDGKTYVVPNDKPVLDHLETCGYFIAPYGKCMDGGNFSADSLIFREEGNPDDLDYIVSYVCGEQKTIDRNLPAEIIRQIDEIEQGRPYYKYNQSYIDVMRFGGTLGLKTASEEEIQRLSESEKKIANIYTYGRVFEPMSINDYVEYALKEGYYLKDQHSIKW